MKQIKKCIEIVSGLIRSTTINYKATAFNLGGILTGRPQVYQSSYPLEINLPLAVMPPEYEANKEMYQCCE